MYGQRSGAPARRRRAAAAVELAVTLPVILGLLVGLWESALNPPANMGAPVCLISFCGRPVRRASLRSPQNR